ncbi:hypothetical protein LOD99_14023 [Oopsacas minuta]|uniref:Uncharacterized protein n=1 Tax=Oopsacas minuta TaxID=111878 RepID=A0AAV7KGG9_9METZ|nr:hypothetical protein LOD99_14023 [Oopsacas minuta]
MFNLTKENGIFVGWVNITAIKRIRIPDTVVDVGVNIDGEYEWVIEYQCIEEFDIIIFEAINFYTRARFPTNDTKMIMMNSAKKYGILEHIKEGELITNDQTNCTYGEEDRKRN